jgi:hypothetical protein
LPRQPERRTVLHPATGVLILAVDWICFGGDLLSAGATTLVTSLAAFLVTAGGTWWIQRTRAHDSWFGAALKALAGGLAAGVPTPIAGTVVGAAVLALSGLQRLRLPRRT